MKEYPKYKHHHTAPAVLVHSREEEEALDEDYKDSPADHGIITHPSVAQMAQKATAPQKSTGPQRASAAPVVAAPADDAVDLSKMTKPQLLAFAKENDVAVDANATKAVIATAIEDALLAKEDE